MNKTVILVLVACAVLLGVTYLVIPKGIFGSEIPYNLTASSTSATAGIVVSQVFAAQSGAVYRAISNLGSITVYLSKKTTSTGFTAGTGYPVFPSSTYEMTAERGNLWAGTIFAITTTGTTTLALQSF
jgi:hypothetical protein